MRYFLLGPGAGMCLGTSDGIILKITPTAGWVQSVTYEDLAGTVTHSKSGVTITGVQWKLGAGEYADVDTFADGAWSVTTITLESGTNTLYVKATDSDGKTKERTLSVSVDIVDPVVDLGADITTTAGTGTTTFTILANMVAETNLDTVEYDLDSAGYTEITLPYDVEVPNDEGDHVITVRATDLSGRTGSDSVGVNFDAGWVASASWNAGLTVNDPGLEADLLSGWNFTSGWTPTNATISDTNTFVTTSAGGYIYKNYAIVVGKIYKNTVAGTVDAGTIQTYVTNKRFVAGDNTWYLSATGTAAVFVGNSNSGATTDISTLTVQEVTISDLIAYKETGNASPTLTLPVTIPTVADGVAGIVFAYVDINNFCWTYYNRGTGKVETWKRVAGVFTSLTNVTAAYSAGANLVVDITTDANLNADILYNGSAVGTTLVISDAALVGQTKHGIMSTSANNTLGKLTVA